MKILALDIGIFVGSLKHNFDRFYCVLTCEIHHEVFIDVVFPFESEIKEKKPASTSLKIPLRSIQVQQSQNNQTW